MPRLGRGRSGKRGHPASLLLVLLITAIVLLAAACSSPGPATGGASTGPVKAVVTPDNSRSIYAVGAGRYWAFGAAAAHIAQPYGGRCGCSWMRGNRADLCS
jgi:hypothetical protein